MSRYNEFKRDVPSQTAPKTSSYNFGGPSKPNFDDRKNRGFGQSTGGVFSKCICLFDFFYFYSI